MQDNAPLVSVLMTCYNREKYIRSAIESVLASTYNNYELIIVDDCSTDDSFNIATEYHNKNSKVRVFLNQKNLGDYPNRNQAASYAKGKYLKYVDADDFIYPWGLELLIEMMEQFPEAGFGLCSLDQNEKNPFPFQLQPFAAYKYHYLGPGLFHKAPLSAIIKRDAFEKAGKFNNIRMAGDFDMWNRLCQHYPVVLMPHGIVWYRIHAEQEVKDRKNYQVVYESLKLQYLSDKLCPLTHSEISKILSEGKAHRVKHKIKNLFKTIRKSFK